MCATDVCTCRRTGTRPITSRSAAWGSLVKVRISGRRVPWFQEWIRHGPGGHRAAQRLGAGQHAKELVGHATTVGPKHAIDDLHPAQRLAQRESASRIYELVANSDGASWMAAIFDSGDIAGGELSLDQTEVAGAPGCLHSAEPRLLAQPRQRAVGVGRVNRES
jgi:hypothetical protein